MIETELGRICQSLLQRREQYGDSRPGPTILFLLVLAYPSESIEHEFN